MVKQFYFNLAQVICLLTVLISNRSSWPIDRTLSGATTPSQSGPESIVNEGVLHIPQSSSFTQASPSDCFMSDPGHSLVWVLLLSGDSVGVFYVPCRLDWYVFSMTPVQCILGLNSVKNIIQNNLFKDSLRLSRNNEWFFTKFEDF